jgi:hypothetical protein
MNFVEPLGPKMVAGFNVYKLHINSQPVAAALYRALKDISDIQLPTELLQSMAFPLKVKAVLRAITNEPLSRDRSAVRLSVMPSTK